MRSNFRKTTIAILLVLCMAISVFAVSAFAEDTNSTSTNADSTSVNHTCERKVVKYTATQAAKYIAGDNTYPELEGYLFAGWYNNEACTKAGLVSGGTPSGEEAFALYIPEHVLSIQAQVSTNLMDEQQTNDAKGSLRFITSVDSLLYKQVGFEVYYTANGVTRKATSASNKVYSKLYEMDSENVWTRTPADTFCNLSKYFKICTLKNFTIQTFVETEFTVKPYWITMDGDKVYGVEATKTFSEGCLRDTVWVSNDGTDAPNFGDYNDPYATLDYAISHVEDGGTVRVKDSLNVASGAPWKAHGKSVTITGDGTNDDSTGEILELETLTFEGGSVRIMNDVTFKGINLTLSYSDGINAIFAEGNRLKIEESVNLTSNGTQLQIFGGSSENVVEDTNLELYAGTYNRIYGGGYGDVSGSTKVTIGGSVNKNAEWETHDNIDNLVFGGCYGATVHGDTIVTVKSGAKANYIYGAGETANSNVLGDTNVIFAGQAYCIYGGSRKGTNADTHVKMEGGTIYQIFGGCESKSMVGDTDVQVLGGKVCRRIYGGCYNANTDSWASENHVTGSTSVTIGTDANVNLQMNDYERFDNSLCALTRDGNLHEDETGTFIFNDHTNCSTNIGKIGHDWITEQAGVSTKTHHYQVHATSGGTVYSAGNCIRIVLEDESAATVTIDGVEKFYTEEKESYYPLPAEHDASVPILVTFGDAKETVSTDYKAKIGSAYYLKLDEAIKAADKMKDADIETINDSTQEVAKITVLPTENGTVTSSCKNCVVGADSTVTLTVTPDEGYNCTGVSVTRDGNTVALDKEVTFDANTYTFTADTAGNYTVEATFARKIFKDNTIWELKNQHNGSVLIQKDVRSNTSDGDTNWVYGYEYIYGDTDFKFTIRDYNTSSKLFRFAVRMGFTNGEYVTFTITNNTSDGSYILQNMGGSILNWTNPGYTLNPAQTANITSENGLEFRIVRVGDTANIYLDGVHAWQADLSVNSSKNPSGVANLKSDIRLRSYGNVGYEVEVPFSISDVPEMGTLTIKDSENGEVVASKTDYVIGDEITLTPEPNPEDAYNCASLMVDGKEVELTDGAYTFTATDISYEVEAVFAPKIFKDSVTTWNLSKQYKKTTVGGTTYDGCVSYPNANGGNSTWLDLYGQYGDIDLTIRVRDYVADYAGKCEGLRQLVQFTFTNGKKASFSITYTGPEDKPDEWSYKLQPMGDSIFGWTDFKALTDEQIASYQDEDGIEFRVLRYGTMVNLYLDGELICEGLDLTSKDSGVTEDMLADVTIRNYDNATENLVIPFTISTDVDRVSVNIEETTNGAFTTPKKNYLKGETVVVTAAGDSGYYYNSFKINGQEVIANYDGTYSFVASETVYEVTGSFAPEFIKSDTGWDLINQNVGIVRATTQNDSGNTNWLYLKDQYTNIDVTMTAREYPDTVKPKLTRTALRFMFTNGEVITFSIAKNTQGSGFKYSIQALSGDNIVSSSYDFYLMNEKEINKFNSEEGIEFRVIRTGTTVDVYLGGVLVVDNFDLTQNSSDVTADMKMDVAIRRFDDPFDTELPLTVSSELPQKATVTIPNNIANGSITTDKEEYIVGEKVTLTVAGEDGYYYDSLTVNEDDITINNDGTYTFTAKETNTITASFKESRFATNGDALNWWNLTNQHKGVVVQTGNYVNANNSVYLNFANTDKHADSDVSILIKKHEKAEEDGCRAAIGYYKSDKGGDKGFSIVYNQNTQKYSFAHASYQNYNVIRELSAEETSLITEGKGLELRVVRIGTQVNVYLDGKLERTETLPYGATETTGIWLKRFDDKNVEVEMPFTMSASAPKTANITTSTDGNGTVTTDKAANAAITDKNYIVGEKVTLTVTGKDGYYCSSLTVNDKEVQPNWDSTYTFTATETNNVTATFAEGPFSDNSSYEKWKWNLSRQNYGVLVPTYESGDSEWVHAPGNYSEIAVGVKDYSGGTGAFSTVAKLSFDGGKYAAFRILDEKTPGEYKIQSFGDTSGNNMSIYGWKFETALGAELSKKIIENGIELKMVREGATLYIYLDGSETPMMTLDLTAYESGVTADTVVTAASIRHYGNPTTDTTTYQVEVPFSLVEIKPVALTLAKDEHGVVTTDVENYFVGDTVTATVSPDAGYVCDTLKVNGSEVALSKKGTYTFEAKDEIYELEPVYKRKIFVDNTAEWNVTNQYNGFIVSNSDGDSPWLFMYDYYEDMDFTIIAKDKMPSDKNFRLVVQFTFENGKYIRMSITNDNMDNYIVQSMQDSIGGWNYIRVNDINSVDPNCVSLLQGDGLEMRVVRKGLTIEVYLNNVKACEYTDLSLDTSSTATGITENMKAKVSIRHYGNNELDIEMPFTIAAENTEVVELHDTDLFYTNSKITDGTDPFILDNTAVDGYYYMYSTQSACYCYRSKDLMNWEYVGNALNYNSTTGIGGMLLEDIWAPEVVYDATDDLYYMFFSATPTADKETASQVLFVATSKYPYKGFELVDFTDESSCGDGNAHDYDTSTYSLDCTKYLVLDPAKYDTFSDKDGGYLGAIDPHPYVEVDENGNETKYLFWVDSRNEDRICGVQMENWLKPMWNTATVLTAHGYDTVANWKSGADKNVEYELKDAGSTINEGPVITKHGGKYYLSFSVNDYKTENYQVAQAVSSDGILGAYHKLTEEEGGLLLSATAAESTKVSGAGHHSFVTVGSQMYIVYHRHNDLVLRGTARNHAIDEVKWVTNSAGLEVMYVNGPTSTVQPKIEAFSDYKNIAGEATVTGSDGLDCLTDGLVSIKGNTTFMDYVSKLTLTAETSYTFEFEELRTIRAIMIYNSGEASFENAKVEYVCEENGKDVTYTIDTVGFDPTISNTEPGAAAYTTLHGYNVKSVKVTVEVPSGQSSAGISEIKILGK